MQCTCLLAINGFFCLMCLRCFCLPEFLYTMCMQCLQRPEEGTRFPWNGVTRGYELPRGLLEIEPRSSGKATTACNCWATFLAHVPASLKLNMFNTEQKINVWICCFLDFCPAVLLWVMVTECLGTSVLSLQPVSYWWQGPWAQNTVELSLVLPQNLSYWNRFVRDAAD